MKTAAQITDEGLFSWSSNISLKRDMDWYSVSSSSVDDLIKITSPADICAGHKRNYGISVYLNITTNNSRSRRPDILEKKGMESLLCIL